MSARLRSVVLSPRPEVPRVKAYAIRSLVDYVERQEGPHGVTALRNALSPAERAALDAPGWAAWRTFELWQAVAHGAAVLFARDAGSEGRKAYLEGAGRFITDHNLTLVHKLVLRMGSIPFLLTRADAIWRSMVDLGELNAHSRAYGDAEAVLHGFPITDTLFCAHLSGWMARYLECCHAREVKVTHTDCRALGAEQCRWEASFREV